MRLLFSCPAFIVRLLAAAVLLAQFGLVQAAALGPLTVRSAIGQKLDADIDITALSSAEAGALSARLAPVATYTDAGLDYPSVAGSLRFSIEKTGERYRVHLSSDQVINDPFITILFELTANGSRTIRQYTLLLDPPLINPAPVTVAAAEVRAAGPDGSAKVAPNVTPNVAPNVTSGVASKVAQQAPPTSASQQPLVPAEPPAGRVVRRGDTLARIASTIQPEDTQLEQVLVALQEANPTAFAGNNINRVKTGSVLTLPDADAVKAIDAGMARKTVRAQAADFNRYRQQLAQQAGAVAPAPPTKAADAEQSANRSSTGKVGVQVNEPGANTAQDRLSLSAAGATPTAASAIAATAAIEASKLDKIASEKALAEANARVAALEKNISDMQALLALKNKTLAEMQSAPPVPAAGTAAPVVESVPEPVVESVAEPALKPELKPAVKPDIKPDTKPDSQPAASVPAETLSFAFWLQDLRVQLVGAATLTLLLGGVLWRRHRRARKAAVDKHGPVPVGEPAPVFGAAGGHHIDTSNSVFHSNFVPSVSQLDTNEVDAVAEADVYIAYGRDEQAEEILLDALRTHPERHALRLKLLEIYAARSDKQKFGKLAADLYSQTGGYGDEWTQAMQMGQHLDPANLLFVPPLPERATTPTAGDHASKIEPSLKLVDPSTPADVLNFDVRLGDLLNARKSGKEDSADKLGERSKGAPVSKIDFSLSGIAPTKTVVSDGAADDSIARALHTKLDLALACQEIGDKDGARELLSEVAGGHHPELALKAKSLLRQLA